MFCKFCGAQLEDNATFCSACGAKLKASEENGVEESISEFTSADSGISEITHLPKKISEKKEKIIDRCLLGGMIAGSVGILGFLLIVIIGAALYGRVYLFDGYTYTVILSIISILLMMIGVCSAVAKTILSLVFKIGKFPTAIVKRILLIGLAVLCLSFSIWGFVDCGKSNSGYSSSSGGSSSNSDSTVSVYLGLSLKVTSIKTSSSYSYVYCSVTNVSSLYGNATMYRYVKVKAVFKDKYGSVLDTDWAYAVDSAWLNPGETKTFYYMVRNTSVASATLSIMS